ncbi:H-2 class II histocompatibility antigen, E-S beta chain-like, partial [Notechis scutatus]|uniref:H-2 class II histocompatibility antigen, E-S beta chain-like n=1 Tax=Notechis scutatus TaxID=8663 RepID=A0A6J1VWL6_9SAUR
MLKARGRNKVKVEPKGRDFTGFLHQAGDDGLWTPNLWPSSSSSSHFLHQWKHKCRFLNGTQRVRLLLRYFYDLDILGGWGWGVEADRWNNDKKSSCSTRRPKWTLSADTTTGCSTTRQHLIGRRPKPTVTISPTKMDPASPNTILLCTARGFYPLEIEVQWLKNSWLEEEDVAFGEELQNGDWTYQLQVMLETQPQRRDLYACWVGHTSLEAPITVQWEPRSSSSARSKLWTGIMGAVIGVAFLAVGLFSYLKNKKDESVPIYQPTYI